LRAAEQDRPDIADKGRRWRVWQRFMDPAWFVFLDETGTATNMARRYGRSPSDRRLVAAVPHGHWRTTTFIAGLRQSGIVAPLVLNGPMTGLAFRAYVEQFLAPALEHVRVGAIKGQILDADGTQVIYDLFTEFGVTQHTEIDFDLDNASPAPGAVKKKCHDIRRKIEDELGVVPYDHIHAVCGPDFFGPCDSNDSDVGQR
jgi:Phage major capsid protein E/DDE superfamily endonuclease